jgi:hypothetical protein
MKNNSALFYTCSLIEFIGRMQKQPRSAVVDFLGKDTLLRIYRFADVFHCEPIEKTADDFITLRQIPQGSFDNVAACRYTVPDYWTIGEVCPPSRIDGQKETRYNGKEGRQRR